MVVFVDDLMTPHTHLDKLPTKMLSSKHCVAHHFE